MTIDINKKYRTKAGSEVRIYATDGSGAWPVHGAVWFREAWWPKQWDTAGNFKHHGTEKWSKLVDSWSLVEVKEKRVVYVNVYPEGPFCDIVHSDRQSADKDAAKNRTGCNRVEIEEGRFDD